MLGCGGTRGGPRALPPRSSQTTGKKGCGPGGAETQSGVTGSFMGLGDRRGQAQIERRCRDARLAGGRRTARWRAAPWGCLAAASAPSFRRKTARSAARGGAGGEQPRGHARAARSRRRTAPGASSVPVVEGAKAARGAELRDLTQDAQACRTADNRLPQP